MNQLVTEQICQAPKNLKKLYLIDCWIDHDHTCYWLAQQNRPDTRTSDGCFPMRFADRENQYVIFIRNGEHTLRVALEPTNRNFGFIRAINSGQQLVLVAGRSEGNSDLNASIYELDGKQQRSFIAGDGVQGVEVTRDNRILISYFDEGVFGDCNLSQKGLCVLDTSGAYIAGLNSSYHWIDDCYAFNAVVSDQIHVCPYMDFPLLSWSPGQSACKIGSCPVQGARAFAINDQYLLTVGGYAKHKALNLIDLSQSRKLKSNFESLPRGRWYWAFGRGSSLYLATKKQVCRIMLPH